MTSRPKLRRVVGRRAARPLLLAVVGAAVVLGSTTIAAARPTAVTPTSQAVAIAYAGYGGNYAKEWSYLHPKWKSVVTQARFVKCERQSFAGLSYKLNSVQAEGTSGLTWKLAVLGKVNVDDVTVAVFFTPAGGSAENRDAEVYLTKYRGHWVRVFPKGWYESYKANKCPA